MSRRAGRGGPLDEGRRRGTQDGQAHKLCHLAGADPVLAEVEPNEDNVQRPTGLKDSSTWPKSRTQSWLSQELCERVPWKTQYGLSSPTRGFVQHALGGKT